MLQAKLQKLAANSGDKKDSIQFQISEEEMEKNGSQILEMRRYDFVKIHAAAEQSQIGDDGTADFPDFTFQSVATSTSLCLTETGIITTITFSIEKPDVFEWAIENHMRNKMVSLSFEEGDNPYNS